MPWLGVYNLAEWLIRLGMVLVILRRRFMPATSLAWLTIVFFLPVFGLVLYGLLGGVRLGRRRVKRHSKISAQTLNDPRLAAQRAYVTRPQVEPQQLAVVLQAEQIGGMPILGGNHVELLADTNETIDRLIADIDAAEHHVHLLFYIFNSDPTGQRVVEALLRASDRGVTCRVLADAAGSRRFFSRSGLAARLNRHGVQALPMLPVRLLRLGLSRIDLRNHRKLAVIDGRIAYTGSQNIVDADYGHRRAGTWIDLMGRFTGPVVSQLQMVFMEDWAFETRQDLVTPDILPTLAPAGEMPAQVVATSPADDAHVVPQVVLAALNAAQRRVIITTPYLVPDEPTLLAMNMAAARGAQVDVVVPARSDHPLVSAAGRFYFDLLTEGGVRIHLHREGLLHAKTITVDDSFALLGSTNLDRRSFYLNFELNVLMYGGQITSRLRFAQSRYLSEADPLDEAAWRRRPRAQRYAQSAAALLSPLL